MLEYEWGNPSTMIFSGDEPVQESDQNRQIYDRYTNNFNDHCIPQQPAAVMTTDFSDHHHHFHPPPQQTHADNNINSFFNYGTTSYPPPHPSMLTLEPVIGNSTGGGDTGGYLMVPKREDISRSMDFSSRIGLNLGGRTYFSTDDDFVNRLYRRSRPVETGSSNLPKCQTEGCNADLTHAKHYHRRHKVCEFHSKASTVIAAGLTQRFCQQCSRFHLLSEFDNGKRSCRKRLADHNRRRRKTHQPPPPPHETQKSQLEKSRNPFSDNLTRSPAESGAQPISTVTVAISPPRMSLDCFRQRPYQATSSSASSSSLFYSSG